MLFYNEKKMFFFFFFLEISFLSVILTIAVQKTVLSVIWGQASSLDLQV